MSQAGFDQDLLYNLLEIFCIVLTMQARTQKEDVYLLDATDSMGLPFLHALGHSVNYNVFAFVFGGPSCLGFSTYCSVIQFKDNQLPGDSKLLKKGLIQSKKNILLPISTRSLEWAAQHCFELAEDWILPPLPTMESLVIARNKGRFNDFLKKNNILTPKTWCAEALTADVLLNLPYPVLLKPKDSFGGLGIIKVETSEFLTKLLEQCTDRSDYIVQEFLAGKERSCGVFCKDGKVVISAMYEQLTAPHKFGPARSYKFIRDDQGLAFIEKITSELKLEGLANFDFLHVPEINSTYVLELNLRPWGSIRGPASYGVNFAEAYCLSALKRTISPQQIQDGYVIQNLDLFYLLPRLILQGTPISKLWTGLSIHYLLRDPYSSLIHAIRAVLR